MKVKLMKNDTMATFGTGDAGFDYWYRPLTVDEKERVRSHIVWKGKRIDFSKTDVSELLLLAVTKLDRFDVDGVGKFTTIEQLLYSPLDLGDVESEMLKAMWIKIWMDQFVPESLKKKLLQDSTPTGTE